MMNRRALLIGSATLATLGATLARAGSVAGTYPDLVYKSWGGTAIDGSDAVAYFTEGRPVEGLRRYTHDWSGATWRFASAENRDAFAADPLAYAPQYGGYCAWAVAAKNSLASTQPENWAIVDGKLYLNFNDDVQATWNTDRAGFIAQGDQNWPGIVAAEA